MYGAIGYWGWPTDDLLPAFEADYTQNYIPKVKAVPGYVRVDAFRADESGRESNVYRVGGMYFADKDAFDAASQTAEWAAMFAYADHLLSTYKIGLAYAVVQD